MLRIVMLAAVLTLGAFPGWAQTSPQAEVLGSAGHALFVANENYDRLRDARGARSVLRAVPALSATGFDVDEATDLSTPALRAALSSLSEALSEGDDPRVILVFAGRVVHAAHGVWLLGTEARVPDFATLDNDGLRLETMLALAGARQGGAVVAIADMGIDERLPAGIGAGVPAGLEIPQGVTLVHGPVDAIGAVLRDLTTPGLTVGAALNGRPGLALQGFNPPYVPFLPADWEPPVDLDLMAWEAAQAADTLEAYQAYLSQWPNGDHAAEAQAAVQRLINTPERIEAALNLTRDERRAIQRDLTLLGFDPRGIDGVFGGGTRAAIAAWQGANRYPQTSYLNRDQVFDLAQQGARRAAQLEAEARARAAEEERRDRIFWRDTGSGSDEAGMRAYLERYPQGIFSSIARERLAQIEAERAREREARDRAAWAEAQRVDTEQAYLAYLAAWPQGLFADRARARIAELRTPIPVPPVVVPPADDDDGPDRAEARAAEEALNLAPITRMLIERRLMQLRYETGPVDGVFDRDTRRAIRRYQRDNGMEPTGFLNQAMVAQLVTEAILAPLR